jgi:hypothetical protein
VYDEFSFWLYFIFLYLFIYCWIFGLSSLYSFIFFEILDLLLVMLTFTAELMQARNSWRKSPVDECVKQLINCPFLARNQAPSLWWTIKKKVLVTGCLFCMSLQNHKDNFIKRVEQDGFYSFPAELYSWGSLFARLAKVL